MGERVAEFEEARPMEGMSAPLQVRAELRNLFDRWLPRPRQHNHFFRTPEVVDELSLLSLCRHYRLQYPGGAEDLAQVWDESEQRASESAPSFSQLVELGWLFFDGGRWIMQSAPHGTHSDIKYPTQSTKAFLLSLGELRLITKTDSIPEDIQALAAKIEDENWLERGISCSAPDRTASRIWEMLCPKPLSRIDVAEHSPTADELAGSESNNPADADTTEIDRAFLEWSAWCEALRVGSRWDIRWEEIEKRYCREAAQRALVRQSYWGTWEDDAPRYANVLANTFAIPVDQLRYARLPMRPPPESLVFRADWLGWPEIEHLMMERRGMNTVGFAFGLLCSELETTDLGPGLNDLARTVISFVTNHPSALQHVLFRVDVAPALLVDLLMDERAACLAAKLIIERRPESRRGSDRNLAREALAKDFAIQDALSLLAYHLDKCTLHPQECSALLNWCYATGLVGIPDERDQ